MTLAINRYGCTTPTALQESGASISTPVYITLTIDQRKALLNQFRHIKTEQMIKEAYSTGKNGGDCLSSIEGELGMSEENLRVALFNRKGLPEKLVIRLQELTGLEIVNADQIRATFEEWINSIF